MPRIARKNLIGNKYIHITTHGIAQEFIFKKEQEKREYIKLMMQNIEKFDIKIIAYCIMDNHNHILIEIKDIKNMSKFMHKVNTCYAIYYNKKHNRKGYVYKERFYSQVILDRKHFINSIIYIHNNPVSANLCTKPNEYNFSSYKDFLKKENIEKTIQLFGSINQYKKMHENVSKDIEFREEIENIEQTKIKERINEYLKEKQITIEEIKKDKENLKNLVEILKNNYKISYRQLEKELNIGRETIRRLLIN